MTAHRSIANPLGTTTEYDEGIEINQSLLTCGDKTGDGGIGGIDPSRLVRDMNCNPVYPWNFVRDNTIYGVIHAAGLHTAWSDKHASYSSVGGFTGTSFDTNVDDYYSPEINSDSANFLLRDVFLTLIVWVYMYIRRISFITSNRISPKDLAVPGALAQLSPPAVSNASDNLKNLFEIPVLFYALSLYLFVNKQVDGLYVSAAWVFVAFRALHSAVHCTFNLVLLRFYLYLFATITVWFIAIRAALTYFSR